MNIVWTEFAIENLKDIFDYYSKKATEKVCHRIRKQILNSTKRLNDNPELGQLEPYLERLKEDHRNLLSGNYKMISKVRYNHHRRF